MSTREKLIEAALETSDAQADYDALLDQEGNFTEEDERRLRDRLDAALETQRVASRAYRNWRPATDAGDGSAL